VEDVNFASLVVTVLLALVGGPVVLRRAGYPWGKTVFGTLTGFAILLGSWAVLSNIQRKTGLEAVPLGWLVPLAAVYAVWRFRGALALTEKHQTDGKVGDAGGQGH
jgi:hypothetical protein